MEILILNPKLALVSHYHLLLVIFTTAIIKLFLLNDGSSTNGGSLQRIDIHKLMVEAPYRANILIFFFQNLQETIRGELSPITQYSTYFNRQREDSGLVVYPALEHRILSIRFKKIQISNNCFVYDLNDLKFFISGADGFIVFDRGTKLRQGSFDHSNRNYKNVWVANFEVQYTNRGLPKELCLPNCVASCLIEFRFCSLGQRWNFMWGYPIIWSSYGSESRALEDHKPLGGIKR